MTLDEILASVQPVPPSAIEATTFQLELELDRLRQRLERQIRRGSNARDIERTLSTLRRVSGS